MVIAVAMSGGVDSSTTAALLKSQGHDVFGITMDNHADWESDIANARQVCEILGMEHYVMPAREEYKRCVMDVFAEYYANGMTPNPCALCNRDIKMNLLLKFARSKGADLMATGHYIQMDVRDDMVEMREATNKKKDQSYFLSLVAKNNLKYVRFPLGEIEDKSITRKMAEEFGLPNFEKEESQDICFIKHGNYKEFLHEFYANLNLSVPGDIVLSGTKKILGKHNGIENYTIGQRRGVGIAYNEPLYVVDVDRNLNQIVVGSSNDWLRSKFNLFSANWILDTTTSFEALVKLRSSSEKTKAQITKTANGASIELLEKSRTPVTPGQICAIYNANNTVIGAGIIASHFNQM